jgi:hypothetical protein
LMLPGLQVYVRWSKIMVGLPIEGDIKRQPEPSVNCLRTQKYTLLTAPGTC